MATTVKRAFGNVATGTADAVLNDEDGTPMAAQAGKRILVLWLFVMAGAAATTVTFNTKGAGAGVPISPAYPLGANGGVVRPESGTGLFRTAKGQNLTVTTGGGGATVAVEVGYTYVDY